METEHTVFIVQNDKREYIIWSTNLDDWEYANVLFTSAEMFHSKRAAQAVADRFNGRVTRLTIIEHED